MNKDEAQQTLTALSILRDEEATYFLLKSKQEQLAMNVLYEDELKANEAFKQALRKFLSDYNMEFVNFVADRLVPQWILRFVDILKSSEKGTKALHACEFLWQKSLMSNIADIKRTAHEMAVDVGLLKQWG
jgi:hypothetical protein